MREIRVFLAGFGQLGQTLAHLLLQYKKEIESRYSMEICLTTIADSQRVYEFPYGIKEEDLENLLTMKGEIGESIGVLEALKESKAHLFIETTPTYLETGEPALSFMKMALDRGMHVVTANKGPLALAYPLLKERALKENLYLGISGAVGAALPTKELGISLQPGYCTGIQGILTGTTNFILTEMQDRKRSMEEVLKEAQNMGIAETDATLDLDGWDTAAKLVILINTVLEKDFSLDQLEILKGIQSLTLEDMEESREKGGSIKLLGEVWYDGTIKASVSPQRIGPEHPLYSVKGKNKGVSYYHSIYGPITLTGGQSGLEATAASLIRDIIQIKEI